jgi:hypothetical protein
MPISLQAVAYIQPASTMLYLGLESGSNGTPVLALPAKIGGAIHGKAGRLMSEPLEVPFWSRRHDPGFGQVAEYLCKGDVSLHARRRNAGVRMKAVRQPVHFEGLEDDLGV